MLGTWRYPHRIVGWREEALAGDIQMHHPVGGVVELAPGMTMGNTVGVGAELVMAEVHRSRELGELWDVEVFARHAVCFVGQVVWMEV
jgi:hypothetical protein